MEMLLEFASVEGQQLSFAHGFCQKALRCQTCRFHAWGFSTCWGADAGRKQVRSNRLKFTYFAKVSSMETFWLSAASYQPAQIISL